MSLELPVIDLRTFGYISTAALFLWPVVVTGTFAAFRWRRLRSRAAFLALGYLMCVGVGAFVRAFGYTFYWVHSVPGTPQDKLVAALINASLSITVIGAILSVGPVLWLRKLLDKRADESGDGLSPSP